MKKFISLLIAFITSVTFIYVPVNATEPEIQAPSAILMEASTGNIIYEKNADEKLRPASITKIMTLILIFDAISEGKIKYTDNVTVSEHAASMGGSQVFLEEGEVQTVETMIKCIAIASANDACVAMAEHICSSEQAFVDRMNSRANELGMTNTNFVNCCGLDADEHMTTARDVAIMSRELISKYPKIHDYSTIWMDTITHVTRKGQSDFTLTNTNKLIKQYEWATGLKTGSTSLAKFCLSATANRNGIELISVVMASPDSKTRVSDSITLLNYGYGLCHLYKDESPPKLDELPVKGNIAGKVSCEYDNVFSHLFLEDFDETLITKDFEYISDLTAPLEKGDTLGQLIYSYNGSVIGTVDIVASESVKESSFGDYFHKMFLGLLCS